jgi:RNA polymerase sigma-70 factor (ECF subfamily)
MDSGSAISTRCAPGTVEGRPAMLVFDQEATMARPSHFVLLEFDGERVAGIRDFLFARYATDGIAMLPLG